MPTGTSVDNLYRDLLKKGYAKSDAAKIAQAKTGLSLVTGRPPKTKGYGPNGYGQYKRPHS